MLGVPGWPPAHVGDTIRMYHDPEDENEEKTVNFTMNPDFIESTSPWPLSIPSFSLSSRFWLVLVSG